MNARVTWLIPIKNGMPYLPETLASIEAQTYKNWEVFVWDNGLTDGTLEELKRWIPSRLPGKVVADKPTNLGVSRAEMVQQCETELCALIDADDINLPERLEKQVTFLTAHPEVAVVGSQMYCMNAQGENSKDLYVVPVQHDDIVHTMLYQNSIAQPSVLFRRSAVLDVGNYRHDVKWNGVNIEDYDLWLRISASYKLANLDLPLVRYRIHSQSTTQQSIRENRLVEAMNYCFSKNAPDLFGCTEDEARLLRERQHSLAIQAFYRVAAHLHQTQGKEPVERLRSDSFITAGKNLTASKDVASRLILASLSKQKFALAKEIVNITKSAISMLPGIRSSVQALRASYNEQKLKNHLKEWLGKQNRNNVSVHPSIEFTGIKPPPFDLVEIDSECTIERDVTIWLSPSLGADPKLKIGHAVFVGRNSYIGAFQQISIGDHTQIGAYTYIISGNHCYQSRDIPIQKQGFVGAPIIIEDNVWLGTHVVVLPGVTIGKGAIVGAGSIVNKSIPSYEVWAGTPAKFIKHRP